MPDAVHCPFATKEGPHRRPACTTHRKRTAPVRPHGAFLTSERSRESSYPIHMVRLHTWRMRSLCIMILAANVAAPMTANAQDRPFVFSVTTPSAPSNPQVRVDYELGVGDSTFHEQTANGPEQRIGVQASLGRLTLVGHVGFSPSTGDGYQSSQQGEVLVSLSAAGSSRLSLAVGGGVLHEAGGTNVLLTRIVVGHETDLTRTHGNLLFEKPFAPGRDAVDLITSVGWAMRVRPTVAVGVELVGDDLEGFWDPSEAEGGARLLVGPSVHIAPPHRRWQLSVAGGPTFHPKPSDRTSDAVRDLPATTATRDFAVRTIFAYRF